MFGLSEEYLYPKFMASRADLRLMSHLFGDQAREARGIEGRGRGRITSHRSFRLVKGRAGRSELPAVVVVVALTVLLIPVLAIQRSAISPLPAPTLRSSTLGWLCGSLVWQTTHLAVGTGGCQATFGVQYAQNFSHWNASTQFNYSFTIDWIGEINASGGLVRIASPLAPASWNGSVSQGSQEVDLSLNQTLNVTNASGQWNPNNTWYGTGAQWKVSNATIATTNLSVTFHLSNVTAGASSNATRNGSYGVKFDVGVVGWPWASSSDRLGVAFESLGAWGAHFTFNSSSETLSELWNSDNRSFVSLVFGGQAGVTYSTTHTASANVTVQSGLYSAAAPDRQAMMLLTFGGVTGNFSNLAYDPYIKFAVGATVVPPPTQTAASGGNGWTSVETALVVAIVAVSVLSVLVVRRHRLRREGEELVAGMVRLISEGRRPPRTP